MDIEVACPKCGKHNVIRPPKWWIDVTHRLEADCTKCKAQIKLELKTGEKND